MNLFEIEKDDIHSKFSDYFLFQSILGFGSFGVVVSAIAKSTRQECAVKVRKNILLLRKKQVFIISFHLRLFTKKI